MTNTIIICHVLTPPAKYEKFIVGSQPMRMREYTTMNNNHIYSETIILSNCYGQIECFVSRNTAILAAVQQLRHLTRGAGGFLIYYS